MPLTKVTPPTPVAAIHRAEVKAATEEVARITVDYLRRLLRGLEYPRTEWTTGTATGVGLGTVTADAAQSVGSGSTPSVFQAGDPAPQATAIRGRRVLLARAVGAEQPVRSVRGFYDGRLYGSVAYAVPVGAEVGRPTEPAEIDMEDLDEENYETYIRSWGEYAAQTVEWLVDREWRQNWRTVTRWTYGTVRSVSKPDKTAVVALEKPINRDQVCGFGTRDWNPAQLVGRYVRVGVDPVVGWWVDDWA
jgi:hypothetical protein